LNAAHCFVNFGHDPFLIAAMPLAIEVGINPSLDHFRSDLNFSVLIRLVVAFAMRLMSTSTIYPDTAPDEWSRITVLVPR
jgi:hypothetical protein